MVSDNKRKSNQDYERNQFFNFFEELSWLLDSNNQLNFKNASKYLNEYRKIILHDNSISSSDTSEYNLIGVLPSLLKDREIFENNSQLAQFSKEVLTLSISRWEKKSRNEIIGLIICEVEDANVERIDTLVKWTRNILQNKNEVKKLQSRAKSAGSMFSWNETIQKLVENLNE